MRRNLMASALALVLALSAAAGAEAQGTIKIGVVGPLTGAFAAGGQSQLTGAQMRANEINAAGGKFKVEILAEDDASNCDQSANATVKLATKDNVAAVIGALNSPCALAMVPLTKRYKVPQFTAGVGTAITRQNSEWVFRTAVAAEGQTRVLADFSVNNLKKSKIAILYSDDEYGASMANGFKDALAKMGLQPASFDSFPRADQDFTGQLTKAKAAGADALFATGAFTASALIAKQAKQLGMNVQLLGDTGNATPKYIELGGEAVEGAVVVEPFTPADPAEKVQNFVKRYREQFNREPDGWTAEMYDTVEIIHQAVQKAGKVDRQAIRDYATTFKPGKPFRGLLGEWVYEANGEVSFPLYKVQIKNGQKVIIGR
jgi:branched-chain amino acid transport system substrate-binding protein